MELIKPGTNLDFVGKMKPAFSLSLALIVISVLSVLLHGGLTMGIDFAGGTLVQLKFQKPATVEQIREALREVNLQDSVIQHFGYEGNEFLVKTASSTSELKGFSDTIEEALATGFAREDFEVRRVEMVGPKVGSDLRQKGLLSILYAMIGILIYITWRFEFRYAVGAVAALFHDVIITVGIFSLLGKEFTLPIVAALLTIIGYSLNDTIVVFDRIRENRRANIRGDLALTVNSSINQTLSRTLLTAGTTLLVVGALFFLGGAVIHDFAFALIVGIVVGTYSSIFIASPVILLWERVRPAKKKKKG